MTLDKMSFSCLFAPELLLIFSKCSQQGSTCFLDLFPCAHIALWCFFLIEQAD